METGVKINTRHNLVIGNKVNNTCNENVPPTSTPLSGPKTAQIERMTKLMTEKR